MTSNEALGRAKKAGTVDVACMMLTMDHVAARLRQIAAAAPTLDARTQSQLAALASQLDAGLGRFGLPETAASLAILDQHAAALGGSLQIRKGGAA